MVHAGLPFTSKIKPMKLSIPSAPSALFSVNQRITEVFLRLHETLDCSVGDSWTNNDPYVFRQNDDLLGSPATLFTGDQQISFVGSYDLSGNVYIQSTKPLPLTLLALRAEFEVYP